MKINAKGYFFGFVTCTLLALNSCATKESFEAQAQQSYKTILLGKETEIENLRKVLNEWSEISTAILRFDQPSCINEDLSIEIFSSLEILSSERSLEYVNENDLRDSLIIGLGTKQLCNYDPSSSNPTWIIKYQNGEYIVLDSLILSE